MKKINLFLSLIICVMLGLTSCGKDDAEEGLKNDPSLLIGQWDVETFERYDCDNPGDDFANDCTDGGGIGCRIYEFLEGGVFNFVLSDGSKEQGTYEVMGANNEVLLINSASGGGGGYVFTITGERLTLEDDGSSTSCASEIILVKI